MTVAFDKGQAHAWLSNLFGDCTGLINIVSTDNWAGQSFSSVDEAVNYVGVLDKRKPSGIYARATTITGHPAKGRGGVDLTREFVGFWADLDMVGPGHKHHVCPDEGRCPNEETAGHHENHVPLIPSVEACMDVIDATGFPAPTEWIHSGGGMYAWWLLPEPFAVDAEQLSTMAELSARWQRVIELAAASLGYHYGAGVGDLSRVLRIPGTVNRKVELGYTDCAWRMDMSSSKPYGLATLVTHLRAAEMTLEPVKAAAPTQVYQPTFTAPVSQPGLRPGDAYNAATTWKQLLEADGCQIFRERGTYVEWVRPGKERRRGGSGTTNFGGADMLKVFSDSWHPLRDGQTYDRFGYYAATRHNGDISAAARQLAAEGFGDRLSSPITNRIDESITINEDGSPGASRPDQPSTPTTPPPKLALNYTDSGFANRFQLRHGHDWRYVSTRQQWLRWDASLWVEDKRGMVTNLIDGMAQEEYAKADEMELAGETKEADQRRTALRPMLSNAKQLGATAVLSRRPAVAVDVDQLDAHRHLVTCDNGTLNLNSYTLQPHQRGDMATKKLAAAYDPEATAPRWEKFLTDVLPDPAMRDYIQRAAGYTLTGDANRKAIFLLHGESNTGKSQFITAMTKIFGGFGETAKEQTFRVNDASNGPTPGLHKLRGARLVAASESNKSSESVKLDEALIKRLTGGGDEVQSRALYKDEESWTPQFAIWLATNYLPKFSADDNAIWRRVKPIAFNVTFGTAEQPEVYDIGATLAREEAPGILNWLLEGVRKYRADGLGEPESLRQGVTDYRNESDPVAQFLQAAVAEGVLSREAVEGEPLMVESRMLYSWFTVWCTDEGIRWPLSVNRFGRRLRTLGYEPGRDASGTKRMWVGLRKLSDVWLGSGHLLRP